VRARYPKCAGSVFQYRDRVGFYQQCLQCGFIRDLKEEIAVVGKPDLKPENGQMRYRDGRYGRL